MAASFEEIQIDSMSGTVLVGRVFMAVWKQEPPDMVARFRRGVELGAAKHKRILHLVVLEQGMPLIENDTRRGIMDVTQAHQQTIGGVTIFIASQGFFAAALRAMVTGMVLMAPKMSVPVKVAGSVRDVASSLEALQRGSPSEAELERALAEVRAKMNAHNSATSTRRPSN